MLYWEKLDYKNKIKYDLASGLSLYLKMFEDGKTSYKFEKVKHLFNT